MHADGQRAQKPGAARAETTSTRSLKTQAEAGGERLKRRPILTE